MPTNINFVGQLDSEGTTQVNFNLPKTLSLGTVKKSFNNSGISEAEGCSYLTLNGLNQTALLGKASLIINPSSFSENALYADLPANSTLGDLTFTRATDAWRTNSAGLIERTPWNLLQYSQTFNNAAWVNTNTTLSVNSAIAPNGTLTAANLVATTGNLQHSIQQNITISQLGDLTFSCYVKNNGGNFVQLVVGAIGFVNPNPYQNFNLQTGTLAGGSLPSSTITSVGDGWYRITVTAANNTTGGASFFIIPILNGTTGRAVPFVGDGINGVYIWGAQLVEGASPLTYFPTTDRQDVPRIDYSLGGCPTILMEPQRTNLQLNSEDISLMGQISVSTTVNQTAGPSGLVTADLITETATTSTHGVFNNYACSVVSGTAYSLSCYFKKGPGATAPDIVQISSPQGFTSLFANYNITTGVVTQSGGTTSTSITSVGNGWWRCSLTATASSTASFSGLAISLTNNNPTSGISPTYLGQTTSNIYAWGAQLEAGSYPTSYIPTTSATVTRNADAATKLGISSLFGQTEGTVAYKLYLNKTVGGGLQVFSTLTNDANTLFYAAYLGNAGQITFDFYIGGVYTFSFSSGVVLSTGVNNIAVVYKAGAYKFFVNGVLTNTNTNATVITSTISRLTLASPLDPFNGAYYSVVAFKTALSDGELELLTGNWFDTYAAMATFYNYTVQ